MTKVTIDGQEYNYDGKEHVSKDGTRYAGQVVDGKIVSIMASGPIHYMSVTDFTNGKVGPQTIVYESEVMNMTTFDSETKLQIYDAAKGTNGVLAGSTALQARFNTAMDEFIDDKTNRLSLQPDDVATVLGIVAAGGKLRLEPKKVPAAYAPGKDENIDNAVANLTNAVNNHSIQNTTEATRISATDIPEKNNTLSI